MAFPVRTDVVEIRVHLPTGETKIAGVDDIFTQPPINLRMPAMVVVDGEERAQQALLPIKPVAVILRDETDPKLWHRWYGAHLEIIERESEIVHVQRPSILTAS